MELILVSSNKLKVILSDEEMIKFNLYEIGNGYAVTDKKQISPLLDEIKKRSGFSADSGSVYIEMFESLGGGCEIFITREIHKLPPKSADDDSIPHTKSVIVYKFQTASDVILASKRLNKNDISCKSKLFSMDGGAFYLSLTFKKGQIPNKSNGLIFMEEYGEQMPHAEIVDYLGEHGSLICKENAVETLAKI